MEQAAIILSAKNISRTYLVGANTIKALAGINLDIHEGEFVAIMGRSGSGKSTLLGILGSLEQPDEGQVYYRSQALGDLADDEKAALRNRAFGFMFQSYSLIPGISAQENVALPMVYAGYDEARRQRKSAIALEIVGLKDRLDHTPAELSGGQQQRVALARALINQPDIVFADEPTASLDEDSSLAVMDLFVGLKQAGKTIVLVTHDPLVAGYADSVYLLDCGVLTRAR